MMESAGQPKEAQRDPFLWSQHTILEREIRHAEDELRRPWVGLLLSGVIAGMGITLSPLLRAAVLSVVGTEAPSLVLQLITASAYSSGFIVVILGHTDLFTEYTTMAILPVLAREASPPALVRLWGLVYAGNLLGVAAFSVMIVVVGPGLDVVEPAVLIEMARHFVEHAWWLILLSSVMTGWLMGLLSWLVSAAGDAITQVILVGVIASAIGFVHLPHAITGSSEMLMGLLVGNQLAWHDGLHVLLWTTVGNAIGGIVFAVLIRFSAMLGGSRKDDGDPGPSSNGR